MKKIILAVVMILIGIAARQVVATNPSVPGFTWNNVVGDFERDGNRITLDFPDESPKSYLKNIHVEGPDDGEIEWFVWSETYSLEGKSNYRFQ